MICRIESKYRTFKLFIQTSIRFQVPMSKGNGIFSSFNIDQNTLKSSTHKNQLPRLNMWNIILRNCLNTFLNLSHMAHQSIIKYAKLGKHLHQLKVKLSRQITDWQQKSLTVFIILEDIRYIQYDSQNLKKIYKIILKLKIFSDIKSESIHRIVIDFYNHENLAHISLYTLI